MKLKWLALASAIALATAAPAFAADYTFTSTFMNSPDVVHIDTVNEDVYMAPMNFTDGVMTLEAWCLDVFHNITLGDQNPALAYDKTTLTTSTSLNGNAPFSTFQIGQFSYLINVLAPTLGNVHQLNAVQGAIWDVALGGGHHVTSSDSTIQGWVNSYADLGLTSTQTVFGLESVDPTGDRQDFGLGSGPVPEPATWAMMITGFLGAGMALRHRRRHLALA